MCGLKKASNFDDLCDTIPSVVRIITEDIMNKWKWIKTSRSALQIINRFKMLYDSVDDIDLFIAGTSERVAEGALVGPTFQCMIGQQFLRIKRGDRYFYDLSGQAGSFTQGTSTT
jgi:peroxidase